MDITGLRSGKLVAVRQTEMTRNGSYLWLCQCDCGRETLQESHKIRSGIVKSCGCARSTDRQKDVANQRFGRLTALYRLDKKRGSSYLWHCRCDCGREVDVPVNALISGNTASCGCQKSERMRQRAKDITNCRFGRLVAIEPTEERMQGGVIWLCRCDCGKMQKVSLNALLSGNTTSCGCKKLDHAPPLHYVDGTCVEIISNRSLRKDNTSGCTGVLQLKDGRWRAEITFKGKRHVLGTFRDKELAITVRRNAEEKIFGEFLESWNKENGTHGEIVPEGVS